MKLKENAFLWFLTGCGAIALATAIDADREPGGFFVAVRVVVCFASAYAGVKAFQAKKEIWTWLLGANAVLYNPFVLVRLTREIWNLVDMADFVLLVAAAIVLRTREDRPIQFGEPGGTDTPVPAAPPKERVYRTPSRTELAIWLMLLFLCLAGVFESQYYGYIDGITQSKAQTRNVGSAILGLPFWAYIVARMTVAASGPHRPGWLPGRLGDAVRSLGGWRVRQGHRRKEGHPCLD